MLSDTSSDCLDAPEQPTRIPTAISMSMVKNSLSVFMLFLSSAFSTVESSRHVSNAAAIFSGMSPFSLSIPRRAPNGAPGDFHLPTDARGNLLLPLARFSVSSERLTCLVKIAHAASWSRRLACAAGFIRECAWRLLYERSAVPFWSVAWSTLNRQHIAEGNIMQNAAGYRGGPICMSFG